jgi:hypothetical protein
MTGLIHDHLKLYARRIREQLRANPDASEPALAPAFQALVENILTLLPAIPQLTVSPEYNNPGVGRPDIALIVPGQPPRAFVELKATSKSADPERWRLPHDRRQYERLKELSHWSASNFVDFQLFSLDQRLGSAGIVPEQALRPEQTDLAANALIDAHDPARFLELLASLARAQPPVARNAQQLAELLAHSARIVRSSVLERLGDLRLAGNTADPLVLVRDTFRNVLYAHPEAGGYSSDDFDDLFASAFAQTLAFGLLLVREPSDAPVDAEAWRRMPDEHPLMKAALRVLSEDEVTSQIGIGFTVMCDTVNSFAPEILAVRSGHDPILYFYEDFLAIFDPAARERYGVYYTPIEVVRYMTGALDRALRDNLGTQGLRDPAVTILDPATGTGTFLLGVAERVRDQVMEAEGGVAASMALGDLAGRMFGLELLVGPYAVAHYRLHHALRFRPADDGEVEPQPVRLPRLGVYLADTLAEPGRVTPIGQLGIQGLPIDEEHREADRIKSSQPILAIIGNPPYRRLAEGENETLVGRWMDGLWDDLKAPVRAAGQGGQLNTFPEFSVAFWRWAIWKLFEADNAPQRGVIAFISNRKFLTGWPYAGLRKLMREKFDRIEVIDLRGDVRAGTRGDVDADQGVFNIMVGTAITLAIADGSKAEGELADVFYTDCWREGLFARRSKLDWLVGGAIDGELPDAVAIQRGAMDDWRPMPFDDGEWLSITEAFQFNLSGMQSKRDHFIYSPDREVLAQRIRNFVTLSGETAQAAFHDSRDRQWSSASAISFDQNLICRAAYRPFDRRFFYNHRAYGDFLRPDLQAAWGESNVGFYSLKSNTGAGPGIWCHGLLPDYHSIKGSNGGYAFPLYDRRAGPDAHNLNPELVAALAEAYGAAQTPEDIFDAILCLLSAQSYTRRFAEDLEDTFPHIPFPADPAVFARAAAIGREIRGLEAFQREPAEAFRPRDFCRIVGQPDASTRMASVSYAEGTLYCWSHGNAAVPGFTGLPQAVWDFSVSGYRVLPRWIEGRRDLPVTLALMRELRDVAARIHELIHWFGEADLVLEATLGETLTREELGFPAPVVEDEAEADDD